MAITRYGLCRANSLILTNKLSLTVHEGYCSLPAEPELLPCSPHAISDLLKHFPFMLVFFVGCFRGGETVVQTKSFFLDAPRAPIRCRWVVLQVSGVLSNSLYIKDAHCTSLVVHLIINSNSQFTTR